MDFYEESLNCFTFVHASQRLNASVDNFPVMVLLWDTLIEMTKGSPTAGGMFSMNRSLDLGIL